MPNKQPGMLAAIIDQADRTKNELSGLVAKEIRQFLAGIELDKILSKALAGQELEIKASIRFKPRKKPKKTATKAV